MNEIIISKKINTIINSKILLIILLGLGIIIAFILFPDYQHTIKFSAIIFGVSITIFFVYYIGKGVHIQVKRDKLEKSFEIIRLHNSKEYIKLRHFLTNELAYKEIPSNDFYEIITKDSEIEYKVLRYLNFLESISIAVQTDYVIEDVIYRDSCVAIYSHFDTLKPFINQDRIKFNTPELYIELEKLALSWKSGKYLLSNEVIPKLINLS